MKIQQCRETSVSCRRSWLSRTFYAVKRGFITDFRLSPGGGETAGYESSAPCRSNVKWLPPGGKGWRVFRSGDENCDCAKSVPIYFHRSNCVRSSRLYVEALRRLLPSRLRATSLPEGGERRRSLGAFVFDRRGCTSRLCASSFRHATRATSLPEGGVGER